MKTFTPQEVNDLERSAYMAGMSVERQRYEKLLENKIMMTQLDFAGYMESAKQEAEERIIKLLESFDPRISIGDILPLLMKGKQKWLSLITINHDW